MPKTERDALADLIPTSEVAALANVDVATVNRWARAGRLRVAVKGPGRTGPNLYSRADVLRVLLAEEVA